MAQQFLMLLCFAVDGHADGHNVDAINRWSCPHLELLLQWIATELVWRHFNLACRLSCACLRAASSTSASDTQDKQCEQKQACQALASLAVHPPSAARSSRVAAGACSASPQPAVLPLAHLQAQQVAPASLAIRAQGVHLAGPVVVGLVADQGVHLGRTPGLVLGAVAVGLGARATCLAARRQDRSRQAHLGLAQRKAAQAACSARKAARPRAAAAAAFSALKATVPHLVVACLHHSPIAAQSVAREAGCLASRQAVQLSAVGAAVCLARKPAALALVAAACSAVRLRQAAVVGFSARLPRPQLTKLRPAWAVCLQARVLQLSSSSSSHNCSSKQAAACLAKRSPAAVAFSPRPGVVRAACLAIQLLSKAAAACLVALAVALLRAPARVLLALLACSATQATPPVPAALAQATASSAVRPRPVAACSATLAPVAQLRAARCLAPRAQRLQVRQPQAEAACLAAAVLRAALQVA